MKPEPVRYAADPYLLADKIKCEVCEICEWAVDKYGKRINVCLYGGPFIGYDVTV